jgi:hypothetical protein
VVEGSGTGELRGLRGEGGFVFGNEDQQSSIALNYRFD